MFIGRACSRDGVFARKRVGVSLLAVKNNVFVVEYAYGIVFDKVVC